MKNTLLAIFRDMFGDSAGVRLYFAPGRVNLIGEHTDYNGGHVFPCALTLGTYAAVRRRADRGLRLYSVNLPEAGVVETGLDELRPLEDQSWAAYVKGVIWAFAQRGLAPETGFDLVLGGDLPFGAGLSSSASVEVLTGYVLRDLYGFDVTDQEIALLGQRAENQYVGMNCGIMDQFASAMGKEDHAIFLDTATLAFEYVPLALAGKKLVVTNSNKKHALANSAYNDRRRECAAALAALQKAADIRSLCELSAEGFEALQNAIPEGPLRKRARHAVTENRRTLEAVRVLRNGDLAAFGRLMNASHISLRDDFEVSCRELDVLAEAAWAVPGVLGSRMTGGGFGGCTVSIVEDGTVERFQAAVGEAYRKKTGHDCTFYIVSAGGGPRKGSSTL